MSSLRALLVVLVAGVCTWSCSQSSGGSSADAGEVVVDSGYAPTGDDGSEGCALDGYPCPDSGDCCSGVCSGGVCGAEGACTDVGAPCDGGDTCCSRVCSAGGCVGED